MEQPKKVPALKYDGTIHLATGSSRTEKKWRNKELNWSEFLDRLQQPTITQETVADYRKMPKSRQGEIKDVGGYVGGWLKEGKRKKGYAQQRSLVTLDADSTNVDFWENVQILFEYACATYTTHSHNIKGPRFRLIIPLKRPVTAEEYEPVARRIAESIGMDNFDDTTYQAERMMFFPSHSIDGEYFTAYEDAPWVDPDQVLSEYEDWRDSSFWPESSRGHTIRETQAKKAGDPLTKKGIVGAFCRTYDIVSAIETYLPDIYGPTAHEDRWTYLSGSTAGGLVIYDGKFAYSHHGTDPVGDQLVNAFDLVRIHKFGDLDEDVRTNTPPTKFKSYRAMAEILQEDDQVMEQIKKDKLGEALDDFDAFADVDEDDDQTDKKKKDNKTNWMGLDGNGQVTINTYLLAQEVLYEVPIFYDGEEFLRYDATKGIWCDGAEEYLRSYLTNKKLLKESKIRYINETIASVKNLAYVEQSFHEADVNKLVLANGVYDLKKNTFSPKFSKKLFARTSHPIDYDAEATCPTFDGYVKAIVGEENAPFVYEWFGYNFYREYTLQKMLFIHGKAGTGKSTLVNLLKDLIGRENYSAVTLKNLMNERFAAAGLYHKTANFDTDAKPEYLADGSLLKQLTGEDTIYADRKNQEPIYYYNYAKLTFAMNELPAMRDFSGGLKRRLLILKVDKKLTKDVKDQFPLAEMKREMAGIFNAAMNGLRRALEQGNFSESEDMKENVRRWVKGNDVLSLFIEDECEVNKNLRTPVKGLYEEYVTYCRGSGYKAMTRNNFNGRMEEMNFTRRAAKENGEVSKYWFGLEPKDSIF